MLNVANEAFMLNVAMLNVIMPSVVALGLVCSRLMTDGENDV